MPSSLHNRWLEPEWLDVLPPENVEATRSRRDLRRINFLMGHAGIAARLWQQFAKEFTPTAVVELGAGDGSWLLALLRRLNRRPSKVILVDQHRAVTPVTLHGFEALGCDAELVVADVFQWTAASSLPAGTVLVNNLFLHHFPAAQLSTLFGLAAERCQLFVACEPRRSRFALVASRLLGLIGCNAITRHDAVISVHAGFLSQELTTLWPADRGWEIREGEAGFFSHIFAACRLTKDNAHRQFNI